LTLVRFASTGATSTYPEILATRLGESWTHYLCWGLTMLVGLVTFFIYQN